MQDFGQTTYFVQETEKNASSLVTVFDSNQTPFTVDLNAFGKSCVYFGRGAENDIVLTSHLVSTEHGRFLYWNNSWVIQDKSEYDYTGSTNGLTYNNAAITSRVIFDGDYIRIDNATETVSNGVLFVFSSADDLEDQWQSAPLWGITQFTIGRDVNCNLVLPHISVSKYHAIITQEVDGYYIVDNNSTNGVIINNKQLLICFTIVFNIMNCYEIITIFYLFVLRLS